MIVTIDRKIQDIMHGMCQVTDLEWSAFATVDIEKDKRGAILSMHVDQIFFVDQECSPTKTEMDDMAVIDLINRAYDEGYGDRMKCWIHSHADMDTFWSKQDDDNIDNLCKDILLSIVVNKAGSILARVDVGLPIRYTINNVPIVSEFNQEIEDFCKDIVKNKIKKKVIQPLYKRRKRTSRAKRVRVNPSQWAEAYDIDGSIETASDWWDQVSTGGEPWLIED